MARRRGRPSERASSENDKTGHDPDAADDACCALVTDREEVDDRDCDEDNEDTRYPDVVCACAGIDRECICRDLPRGRSEQSHDSENACHDDGEARVAKRHIGQLARNDDKREAAERERGEKYPGDVWQGLYKRRNGHREGAAELVAIERGKYRCALLDRVRRDRVEDQLNVADALRGVATEDLGHLLRPRPVVGRVRRRVRA